MEIDDKIYQEAIEVLRIKLRNTSAEMAFVENHSHQPEWYLHGMMRGLEIGYAIIKDLQNKIDDIERRLRNFKDKLKIFDGITSISEAR